MNDLARSEFYDALEELLDNFDEMIEDHELDMQSDDELADIADHFQRVRAIVSGDED